MSKAESQANWKGLYQVGGAAALLAAGLEIAAALIGVISSSTSGPPPSTVIGFFTLLQHNRFLGLVDLGLFDIAALTLLIPMVLAVYFAQRRASPSAMTIATALYFVGIGVYLATETAFSLLSLSEQYAAAKTDAERTLLEASGQAMLAEQVGAGTGTYMAFVLVGVASLIIAIVMLRSNTFGTLTASVGILANGILLAYYVGVVFVSTRLAPGALLFWVSGLLSLVWFILIGRRLFMLAGSESGNETQQDRKDGDFL
jgi:hypothetical protein